MATGSGAGAGSFARKGKEKDIFLDGWWISEINKRHNKDASLYQGYQINPYTKKTMDSTTRKVNERRPRVEVTGIPGYASIRDSMWKPYRSPPTKKCHPQTEVQRFGWFPQGTGIAGEESCDERFSFTHTTAEFIKTDASIRAYDKLMKNLTTAMLKEAKTSNN